MTAQERADLLTIVKASELPTHLVEARTEYNKRLSTINKETEGHRNPNGTYKLEDVKTICGEDVSELANTDKLQLIWKEMRQVESIGGELESLASIHEERRRLARQQLSAVERRDIRFEEPSARATSVDRIVKSVQDSRASGSKEYVDLDDIDMRIVGSDPGDSGAGAVVHGFPPEATRTGHMQWIGYQQPNLREIFPIMQTNQHKVVYMEEVTPNEADDSTDGPSNIRTIAQARLYPEASLKFEERDAPIVKLGTMLHVTEEQLEDEPQMKGIIGMKLPQWMRRKEDYYVIHGLTAGSDSAANMPKANDRAYPGFGGLENMSADLTGSSSSILSVAKTADDNVPNILHLGLTKVMHEGYAMPGPFLMNPMDWHRIATLQTADGHYMWAHPSQQPTPMVWAHRVIVNNNITEGTAYSGDFANHSTWVERVGVEVAYGYINDNFGRDIRTIKIRTRVGIIFYRPSAFVKYTGLNA